MSNTEEIIENSLNDFTAEVTEPEVEVTPDVEVSTEVDSEVEVVTDEIKPLSMEVTSPAEKLEKAKSPAVEDAFAKQFGIAAKSVTGGENRIPYSRVKKIVTKAQSDAKAEAKLEFEKEFQPTKYKEYESKVTDYEGRLKKVDEFENLLEHEPKRFLELLSQVPAYKDFFAHINQLAASKEAPAVEKAPINKGFDNDPADPMPQPNRTNPDGSKVYDLDGLNELMAWNARQVEKKVSSQMESRFTERLKPIEQERERREYIAKITPVVDQQIAEARTWDRFGELEAEIVTLLNKDKNISLERAYTIAYQKNIVPKLTSDRNKIRTEVMAELRNKPVTTAAPVRATSPRQVQDNTKLTLEEIIAAELAKVAG